MQPQVPMKLSFPTGIWGCGHDLTFLVADQDGSIKEARWGRIWRVTTWARTWRVVAKTRNEQKHLHLRISFANQTWTFLPGSFLLYRIYPGMLLSSSSE